jgi:tetratricopeptide (TPR) repeat protein
MRNNFNIQIIRYLDQFKNRGLIAGINRKALIPAILSLLVFNCLPAQNIPSGSSGKDAFNSYSQGNYLDAYKGFTGLLEIYPKDPLYKYYSGVCLVRLKKEPVKAAAFLQEALSSSHEIRSVPGDAWFYLGRSQQMSGQFQAAMGSFEKFTSEEGRKASRKFGVQEYIEECKQGKGRIEEGEASLAELNYKKDLQEGKSSYNVSGQLIPGDSAKTAVSPKSYANRKEPVPEDIDKKLSEALRYQAVSDSLNKVNEEYRSNFYSLPDSMKPGAKRKISETGSLAENYRKLADDKLRNSDSSLAPQNDLLSINGKQKVQEGSRDVSGGAQADMRSQQQEEPVFSDFEVIRDPARLQSQKIEIDPVLPPGMIYRIQMGVFSKPVEPAVFKGISPLYGFKIKGSGMIRYFAGMFRRLDDANRALLEIKRLGFKDSFIVAASDGVTVSLERAALLEKEWGSKPLSVKISPPDVNSQNEAAPLTLSFRVELIRTDKPVKEDVEESYRRLAGNKSFEILAPVDGQYVYLIGNFITFESASEYSDLLNRNGYRDAKVVSYLGKREIPVETAKQLFKKIE